MNADFTTQRDRCLEHFLRCSREFALLLTTSSEETVMERLPSFEKRRNDLLKAFDFFQKKIDNTSDTRQIPPPTQLVTAIIDIDLTIISAIEKIKGSLHREIQESRNTKNTLGKFKSGSESPQGRGLDERV